MNVPLEERIAVNRRLRLVEREAEITLAEEGCRTSGRCNASIAFTTHRTTADYIQFFK